jgi:hypothetical protein
MWQLTPHVFTTELGEPCVPRNALRALKAAAKRAGLPPLGRAAHTAAFCCLGDVVRWRAAQGGIGRLRSHERCDHWRHLRARDALVIASPGRLRRSRLGLAR